LFFCSTMLIKLFSPGAANSRQDRTVPFARTYANDTTAASCSIHSPLPLRAAGFQSKYKRLIRPVWPTLSAFPLALLRARTNLLVCSGQAVTELASIERDVGTHSSFRTAAFLTMSWVRHPRPSDNRTRTWDPKSLSLQTP